MLYCISEIVLLFFYFKLQFRSIRIMNAEDVRMMNRDPLKIKVDLICRYLSVLNQNI